MLTKISSLTNPISCPRCKSENTIKEYQEIPADGITIRAEKQTCQNCQTRWYFEENIIAVLYTMSNQKSGNTVIETSDKED